MALLVRRCFFASNFSTSTCLRRTISAKTGFLIQLRMVLCVTFSSAATSSSLRPQATSRCTAVLNLCSIFRFIDLSLGYGLGQSKFTEIV